MNLRRMRFIINGVTRFVVCNPERDSLADALRRLGLTGTKIGCNCGQCGACTVLLDGVPVRACVKKVKNIAEFSEIVTIEGIGTPMNLHPLQQAWIAYGGVQCGFCAPGFIVSAKGLLDANPSPARQDVRAWFQKNHNICRCTGYKPLVDAVMAAAAVMRGEKGMKDISFDLDPRGSLYGSRYPKPTALEKVTGLCDYGDDVGLKMPEGTLHLALVQPDTQHARILSIDCSKAEAMPGVVKVVTAKDIKGTNRANLPQVNPLAYKQPIKPVICDEKIFRYGDVAAVVAAYTQEQARAAAAAVVIELEELPVYGTALEALDSNAIGIHKETPNIYASMRLNKGDDTRGIFPEAAHVVEGSFYSSREPHLPIEPDTLQAYMDEEGRVTIHSKSQTLYAHRGIVAGALGLPPEKVRIIENPTGGSFGSAMNTTPLALVGACAIAAEAPVTLTMTYPQHQAFSGKRAPSYINARMACDEKGKITGIEYDMVLEHGAYPETCSRLLDKAIRFIGNPYNVPNINGVLRSVLSNVSFGIQYRGFAAPQSYTASEALMDMMAEKIGMDPFEFRYLNIARPGDTTPNNVPYNEYPMEAMMDALRPHYKEALARAKAQSTETKKRGIGVSWGGYHVSTAGDYCEVSMGLDPDDKFVHYSSWAAQGQGADIGALTHAHETLRSLGVNVTPGQIRLVMNDTAFTPNTGPAAGSRSHYMAGNATRDAAEKLLAAMRKPDGALRTYAEMKAEGIPVKYLGTYTVINEFPPIDIINGHGRGSPEANYMLYVVEVEVDTTTFKTKVLSLRAIADVGAVGNQLAVEGQAYGGASHTIGFALSEDYSDLKRHSTILGAGIPQIEDIPDDMEFYFHVTPRKKGPFGSSGCSEGFQSSSHVAVLNAINNAIGVRIYEMPAKPEKLKAAYEAKQAGQEIKPAPYAFGREFYTDYDSFDKLDIK